MRRSIGREHDEREHGRAEGKQSSRDQPEKDESRDRAKQGNEAHCALRLAKAAEHGLLEEQEARGRALNEVQPSQKLPR